MWHESHLHSPGWLHQALCTVRRLVLGFQGGNPPPTARETLYGDTGSGQFPAGTSLDTGLQ